MAYTSDDLARVQRAIAQGATTVRYADRAVEFRSMAELVKLEAYITRQLASKGRKDVVQVHNGE